MSSDQAMYYTGLTSKLLKEKKMALYKATAFIASMSGAQLSYPSFSPTVDDQIVHLLSFAFT